MSANFTSDDLPTLRKLERIGVNMQDAKHSRACRSSGDFLAGFCRDLAMEIEVSR